MSGLRATNVASRNRSSTWVVTRVDEWNAGSVTWFSGKGEIKKLNSQNQSK